MNRMIFLIPMILLACNKDKNKPDAGETFQKLQSRMWKEDSIVHIYSDGKREVSIPPIMHSSYLKFTSTHIQYYSSFNLEPPALLESHPAIYKQPNILEAWHPAITSGPPFYKFEIDSVSDTRLRCNYLNTPGYIKAREYYYHAY